MKKRRIMVISSLLLAVLMIAGGTMAWFTAESGPKVNKFKAGTLTIELKEIFNHKKAQNVNPGDCFKKGIYVKNTGSKKAYIRIKADAIFTDGLSTDILNFDVTKPHLWNLWNGWEYKDGYFYYKKMVYPGHTTAPLLKYNRICFDKSMGNEYQGAELKITVNAEAIQTTNGAPADLWPDAPFMMPFSVDGEEEVEKITEEQVIQMIEDSTSDIVEPEE